MSRLARTINVIQKECQTHCHSKQLQLHPFPWFHFESALKPEDFCPTQFLPYALSTKAPVPAKRAAGNGGNPLLRHLDCLDWGMFRCFNTGCFIRCFSSMEAVTYDFSRLWSPKCEIFWWEDVSCFWTQACSERLLWTVCWASAADANNKNLKKVVPAEANTFAKGCQLNRGFPCSFKKWWF